MTLSTTSCKLYRVLWDSELRTFLVDTKRVGKRRAEGI